MPDAKIVEAMMKFNEDLQKAGVLLALEGLRRQWGARLFLEANSRSRTAHS